MHSTTILVLFGLSAIAFAQFGRGGPGGPGKLPLSCKNDGDQTKQCFETNLQGKGVNIKMEDVMKCFAGCQSEEHAKGGFGKGAFPKGEFPKGGQASASGDANAKVGPASFGGQAKGNGSWEQFKDVFQQLHQCMEGKLGDKQQTCESGKITFALAEPVAKGEHAKEGPNGGPHGGPPMGFGFGNPLKMLSERVAKCGGTTETCVRAAMGAWYDKTDELSQILCDASTACPHVSSEQCKSELKQIRTASCECREQLKPDVEQATSDCTTDENRDAIARMTQRAGGVAKQSNIDCDSIGQQDHPEHVQQPSSPFCPRPEGEAQPVFAKGQARFGVAAKTGGQ